MQKYFSKTFPLLAYVDLFSQAKPPINHYWYYQQIETYVDVSKTAEVKNSCQSQATFSKPQKQKCELMSKRGDVSVCSLTVKTKKATSQAINISTQRTNQHLKQVRRGTD